MISSAKHILQISWVCDSGWSCYSLQRGLFSNILLRDKMFWHKDVKILWLMWLNLQWESCIAVCAWQKASSLLKVGCWHVYGPMTFKTQRYSYKLKIYLGRLVELSLNNMNYIIYFYVNYPHIFRFCQVDLSQIVQNIWTCFRYSVWLWVPFSHLKCTK